MSTHENRRARRQPLAWRLRAMVLIGIAQCASVSEIASDLERRLRG